MAKLRFNNENEAPWPDEDSANLPISDGEGTRVGCELQEWHHAKQSEDFLLGSPAVNRTLILGDSIIALEFRVWP
jgi:hypothetical protein